MSAKDTPVPLVTMTSTTLLNGLKDSHNETRWRQYVDRYRPLLTAFVQRRGLSDIDGEDVTQNVLLEFSRAYREGRYDRQKGRLRSWLFGIAVRQLAGYRRLSERHPLPISDLDDQQHPAEPESENELERIWEEEWQRAVLRQCLVEISREVQPQTLKIFEQFAIQGKPADEVARTLNVSEDTVYSAKRRIMRRVRDLLPLMEEIW
jgi:RNA polymerase sigma factor (sigma-70 family)